MTYDPTKDEPLYSEREVEELIKQAIRQTVEAAFRLGREMMIESAAALPLTIEGRWRRDKVYQSHALVYHETKQWLAMAETASEPSLENALWKLVDFPRIGPDTISRPGKNEEGK
jgi:hypothetical protein